MEHNFATLTTILSRCSAKLASEALAEIRALIADAAHDQSQPTEAVDTMSNEIEHIKQQKAEVRAARRAAKKAEREAAEKVAHEAQEAAQAQPAFVEDISHDHACCILGRMALSKPYPEPFDGEAEATIRQAAELKLGIDNTDDQPTIAPGFINRPMAGYLKRCSEEHIQTIINSYIQLLFTGAVYLPGDPRYLNNFILLARAYGIVTTGSAIAPEQLDYYLRQNPVLPLNRAQRRHLQRRQKSAKSPMDRKILQFGAL